MKKSVLHAAILSLTMPLSLYGLGLGEMVIKSSLDQPFLAEIELVDVGSNSLSTIKIGVADPEQFEEIGLHRAAILSLLNFKIGKNSQGKTVIIVQSDDRMTEPYMEIVVDLAWPNGQLYKTYTVLLDPPGYKLGETIAQSKPSYYKKKSSKYESVPGVVEKPIIGSVDHNPVNLNDDKKKTTYGPTIANENVWQIAQRYKTSSLILPQVVLAIVGSNPDAFTNGNLNGLKVGVRLVIPSTEEIEKIPSDLAVEEVMAHDKAWTDKTEINHVLAPPYMNGQNATPMSQPKNSEIPTIPKLNEQNAIPKDSFPQIIQNITANPINASAQKPKQITASQEAEQDAKTKAEISITSAAVETVRESNALLMEQLRLLNAQNKKLQDKLDQRDKELEHLREKLQVIIKERQSVASQANSIKPSTDSTSVWPYIFVLLVLAGGGGGGAFAYWYFRMREQKSVEQEPVNSKTEPNTPPVEPETLKPHEVSNVVRAVTSIVEQHPIEVPEEPKEEIVPPVEKEHTPQLDSASKFSSKHPRPLASIIAEKSTGETTTDFDQSMSLETMKLLSEGSEEESDELEFEPDTAIDERAEPQKIQTHEIESEPLAEPQLPEIVPTVQIEPVQAEPSLENKTEETQLGAIEFDSNPLQETTKDVSPATEYATKAPVEDTLVNKDEQGSAEELGALEFESGLHETIKEDKQSPTLESKEQKEEDSSMNIEFISPLSGIDESKPQMDETELDALVKDIESNEKPKSETDEPDSFSLDLDLSQDEEDKDKSETQEQSEDHNIQLDVESISDSETEDSEKTESPLKSKKALDTLLDLAKTYISMGDIESAKASLEEVIEHGSVTQKKEAKKLLKTL